MSNERGIMLFQTGRYDLAEEQFRAALLQEPGNAYSHAMIGLCLLQRKEYGEATTEASEAIRLRPDWAFGYTTLASIYSQRERLKEAVAVIEQAISLDPGNPANLAILAGIRLKQSQWKEALAAADRGLQIDPEDERCVNARGIALVHLGRRDEASQTIQGALSRDPENATTHANQGWALLHSGDHKAALEHFREALRLDPESQWAKAGIVEAMKARNPIYRLMLKYFLFMARLNPRVRFGIIIGGYFGYQILSQAEANNPSIKPFALPIMIAYVIFAYMSWLAAPAFNLMLRIDRFGKYALSPDQRRGSTWFGATLALGLALFAWGWFIGNSHIWLAGVLTAVLSIPITATFSCDKGWPRRTMAIYTAALAAIGATSITLELLHPEGMADPKYGDSIHSLFNCYIYGLLISQFLANYLISQRAKK